MQPIVKWAGGKRFIAPGFARIIKALKASSYIEPFAGGAAVFFALEGVLQSVLSDTNAALIDFYEVVKSEPQALISAVQRLGRGEKNYYRVRASHPRNPVTRAARLYYLTRFAFNGIYRENLRGEFNVPYGYKNHLKLADRETLLAASSYLNSATLLRCDFRDSLSGVVPDRVIYADPPYTVRHNNNGFIKYNRRLFSWRDQIELAEILTWQAQNGAFVFVSNADHADVSALYGAFVKLELSRSSVMAADSGSRGFVTESLFVSKSVIGQLVKGGWSIGNI